MALAELARAAYPHWLLSGKGKGANMQRSATAVVPRRPPSIFVPGAGSSP